MNDIDRIVAGVTCRDVLHDLSDFVDGVLSSDRVAQLQLHLAGCDVCARFGGAVTTAVQALRATRPTDATMPSDVAARLRARLTDAVGHP